MKLCLMKKRGRAKKMEVDVNKTGPHSYFCPPRLPPYAAAAAVVVAAAVAEIVVAGTEAKPVAGDGGGDALVAVAESDKGCDQTPEPKQVRCLHY